MKHSTMHDSTGALDVRAPMPEIQPVKLGGPIISIGRDPDNTVVLNHPLVSRHHADLELLNNGVYRIVDLHSTHHVYVDGRLVKVKLLNPGDVIGIGPFKLNYTGKELVQLDTGDSIRIDALHLKQYGNLLTLLLDDISLTIPPHKFVALVGSSGVGKTTLLNALSGLEPARRGTVLYNGQDYYRHLAAFSTQIGYVPQDDIVHRRLTVANALYYTARMRLPHDFTHAQIKQRVDEVLEDVDLKHRRRQMVRKLSGGERKRVSIALELLANPSVFFLDEPCADLDPGLDLKMMLLLRELADKGHTIILVTHATANIDVCDSVCFIVRGGRLAFYGSPQEAKTYFGTTNFAEIYNSLEPTEEDKNIPKEAETRYKRSPYYQHYIVEPLKQYLAEQHDETEVNKIRAPSRHANPWRQFSLLSRRYLHLLKNDVPNLLILLLQAPIIALILFYLAGQGTFAPTSIANCPLRQDPIHNAGRIVSINCQRVVDLLNTPQGAAFAQPQHRTKQQLLQSAILVYVVNLKAPFHQGIFLPVIAEIYITMALAALAGLMIGLLISAIVRNTDRAMSFVPLVLVPQVIFSGAVFKLDTPILKTMGALFAVRWAMAGMGSSVGLHPDKLGVDNFAYQGTLFVSLNPASVTPGAIMHLLIVWSALVVMIIALGFAIGAVMKRKDIRR